MKILVIAPHPDDEVLGCGGTIAKHATNGDEVHLCIVTKTYPPDWSDEYRKNIERQIEKSAEILGIKVVHKLGFPTVKLDTIPQKELNDSISNIVDEVKPDILYIPHNSDLNKDHGIVFNACLIAARPVNNSIKRVFSYETLSETEWGQSAEPFVPNTYVDISETMERKKDAMKAYASELKEPPHPRSLKIIEALAKKRGSEAGMMFSEAFILLRDSSR